MTKKAINKQILAAIVSSVILILAASLRLWQLDQLPSILNRDEAALAYNALLLKETGQDEWSRAWPLALESFGDYKLPGYPWLLIASFSLFGYHDWVVRLPSAVAGVGLIIAGYYLARAVGLTTKYRYLFSFFLALSPIFIFYSRMAFEANVALTLLVTVITLLMSKVSSNKRGLVDMVAVGLSLLATLTYNTPLLLLPFIIVLIPVLRGFKNWWSWLLPVVGLTLVLTSLLWLLLPLTSQKQGITIFSDETVQIEYGDYRSQFSGLSQRVLGNRYVYYAQLMSQRLGASLTPEFLVTRGGSHPWHQLPNYGHIYWTIYLLAMIGTIAILFSAYQQLQKKQVNLSRLAILYLAGISLLPSIVTVDSPHATRSLLFFVWICLLAVEGAAVLAKFSQRWLLPAIVLLVLVEAIWYARAYFGLYPAQQWAFMPGFDDHLTEIQQTYPDDRVAIVDSEGYHYILLAWYLKISPQVFLETVVRQQPNQIGFKYGEQVERFRFIGQKADRRGEEVVLLEWNPLTAAWEVTEYR